jgi:3-hydroxyisobutyrate dehydrogenase
MIASPTIGFVGIGNMGAPMVRCLGKGGHAVRLFDLNAKSMAPFAGVKGFETAANLADLGAGLNIVITMLPEGKAVQAAAFGTPGSPGFAAQMASGGIIVDMSSSYPLDTITLAGRANELKLHVVDAPVSGGVGKAVTGTLAIMAGGDASVIDRVEPALKALGTVHRTGKLGSGHAMKALNNYVSAAGLIATCEALHIGARFGLDPAVLTSVLNASTGRNNTTENKAARYLIPKTYNSGFSLALMSKDVSMARALAEDLGAATDELEFVADYLKRAAKALGPDADHTAVMAHVESSDTA